MPLIDDVKSRIPVKRLVQLTNADDTTATTINDTVLQNACDDAEDIFTVRVGVLYDNSKPFYLAHIIDGVLVCLMKRVERGNQAAQDMAEQWYDQLAILRQTIGGNLRLSPATDSEMTPSKDKRGVTTSIVRPAFDPAKFDSLRPNPPFGTNSGNDSDN